MTSTSKAFRLHSLPAVLFSSLALCACGGGGGAAPESAPAPGPQSGAPSTDVRAFSGIAAPASFTWSTVNETLNPSLVLQRAGGEVGAVRLVISNFIETDPTGSGAPIEAMSTDVIVTVLTSTTNTAPLSLQLPTLRLPAATTEVLVEVFAIAGSERLAWRKVKVSDLSSGTVELRL
jgi:hypothetical protein